MKYVINLGELLVDVIPTAQIRLGETCYTPHPGGAIANVAVAIARLGGMTRFIGGVSEDQFGKLLMQILIDNHVDTRYACLKKEAPTAIALVTLQENGQRHFTFFRDETADVQLRSEDLNWQAWDDAAICHIGGVSLSREPARSTTLAAIEHTHVTGSIVSFDVNIRSALWASQEDIRETISNVLQKADILKLSVEEAEFLSAQPNASPELLERNQVYSLGTAFLEKGPGLVVITQGANGVILLTKNHQVEIPAMRVCAIDTTGAGDAFMGAMLYALEQHGCHTPTDLAYLSKETLSKLGSFANEVAGLSCTRYGGISSFPFANEVNSLSGLQGQPDNDQS